MLESKQHKAMIKLTQNLENLCLDNNNVNIDLMEMVKLIQLTIPGKSKVKFKRYLSAMEYEIEDGYIRSFVKEKQLPTYINMYSEPTLRNFATGKVVRKYNEC